MRQTTTDQATGQVQSVITYTIGLNLISQTTTPYTDGVAGTPQALIFGYDGHGSVRVLLDMTAAIATVSDVQQLFHYDAYGKLLNVTPLQAATTILYSGQMLDPTTGLYDNRARWYDPQTGRFVQLDPFFGSLQDPLTLHKYLYGASDPVNNTDPSGEFWLGVLYIGVLGGLFGVLGNGLGNLSHNRGFFEGWQSAFLWGAGLALATTLFPAAGVLFAGIGLGTAIDNWSDVWNDPDTTPEQKWAATGLVLLSAVGAFFSANYGAKASQKGGFWINPGGFGVSGYRGFVGKIMGLRDAMVDVGRSQHGSKTTALSVIENPSTGKMFLAAMSNETSGYVRPEMKAVLPRNTEYPTFNPNNVPAQYRGPTGNPHAEVRTWFWAKSQGFKMLAVVASKVTGQEGVCTGSCVPFLTARGVAIGGPISPQVAGPFAPLLGILGFAPEEIENELQ